MYDKNVAVIGCTIEKTTKYDQFREDKIRMELKIVDDSGKEVPCKEIGNVQLKGTNICESYYHIEKSPIDKEGWLDTGDMGYLNEDSYLYIVDRKKDMINRGGEKIWCNDVENEITSLNDYMDKLALSKDWGNRNTVKVARIPAGTKVKYAVGTAREQLLITDPRPGGGIQYLFNQFDTEWITEVRSFSN